MSRTDTIHRGILLSSRHDLQREIDAMKAALDILPELSRVRIESMYCDSKAGAHYTVKIRDGKWAVELDDHIDRAFRVGGSYDGISILGAPEEIYLEGWSDEEGEHCE
jgi:hypothetical protein